MKGRVPPGPDLPRGAPPGVDAHEAGHQAADVRVVGLRAEDQLQRGLGHGPELVPADGLQFGER